MKSAEMPESIASAAILFKGETFTGVNHGIAVQALEKAHPDWHTMGEKPIQGFLTSTRRFVDREEAGEIAMKAEQLSHLDRPDEAASHLHSEHLLH